VAGFAAGAIALAVLYAGNNLPSAFYGTFRHVMAFSPLTQTLLYAVAVAVILPGLLIFGPLSDAVGRRLPILLGLAMFAAGDVLFAAADGVGWLFAARVAQGLGMGMAAAAAQAALGDSVPGFRPSPGHGQRLAAVTATACITFGLAGGPLLGGLLAQYGPAPLRLAFFVHLALVVLGALAALRAPGRPTGARRGWRLAGVGVPPPIRRTFTFVAASSFLAWAVLGIFSAVLPSLVGGLLRTTNLAFTAGALSLMIATSGLVQLGVRRLEPRLAQAIGLIVLASGLALLVGAGTTNSLPLTALAMLATGSGHGLVFSGAQHELGAVTSPDNRGAVTGAYYMASYLGLGGPVIGVGLLALSHGLTAATSMVSVVIAALCLVVTPLIALERRRAVNAAGLRPSGQTDAVIR